MFAKSKISQSMIDAVNSVITEEEKKRLINDDELGETGFHKAAHAAKKAGQSHFEFQGKKYPATARSTAESIEEASPVKIATSSGTKVLGTRYGNSAKAHRDATADTLAAVKGPKDKELKALDKEPKRNLDEDGDCVTPPQAKDIAKKEVGKHEKGMHGKKGEVAKHVKSMHKENVFLKFAKELQENKSTGTEPTFTDNNLGEEEMTDKQKAKREKIVLSMKSGEAGMKQRYGKNWKNVMYATATKQAMKEDSSDVYEGEELDELSKSTLGSYVKKASVDRVRQTDKMHAGTDGQNAFDRDDRRSKGIPKAIDRLTKEEVETFEFQLIEGSYGDLHKKWGDTHNIEYHSHTLYPKHTVTKFDNEKDAESHAKKVGGTVRMSVSPKMKKEEVEQIDEISKTLAANYRHKAHDQIANAFINNKPTRFLGMNFPVSKKTAEKNSALIKKRSKGIKAARDRVDGDTTRPGLSFGNNNKKTNEEVELDEASPAKNQDVADKAYLKHKPGTVKGQLTQIGRFLRGKPEIKESNDSHTHAAHYENDKGEWTGMNLFTAKDDDDAIKQAQAKCKEGCKLSKVERHTTVKEDVDVIQDKNGHKITTDMLSGRVEGGKLNSFKNFKVNLVTSGEETIPTEVDKGEDTKEKQKITTNPGPVDIKFDDKLGHPTVQSHFEAEHQITHESTEPPFDKPYKTVPKDVTDKSGAKHTPMSRARDLARQSFKKLKKETMMGKISN